MDQQIIEAIADALEDPSGLLSDFNSLPFSEREILFRFSSFLEECRSNDSLKSRLMYT